MSVSMMISLAVLSVIVLSGVSFFLALFFRRVVPTNKVHIVQYRNHTMSYGKDEENGNVYYEWPSFLPLIGVTKIVLPVSVFSIELKNYAAYDIGRVPFVLDIQAFFHIKDSRIAAARISSFEELQMQLIGVLQGASRAMLASSEIEEILQGRAAFGESFTKEVGGQLENWGVETVKNIELMDIKDAADSTVIADIMTKKKSLIEMQSRIEVAKNVKSAEIAEAEATRDAELKRVEAKQAVETRIAEQERAIGVAKEQAKQDVQEQARLTKEKEMSVVAVNNIRLAEIAKQQGIIKAEEEKQKVVLAAEAQLEAERRGAEAVFAVGQAKAESEKLLQLAPVEAQIVLAKEIGENEGYQKYLITIRQIEASQSVGLAQAGALEKANVKVIANTGGQDVGVGINSIGELFTPKGGLGLGAALEAFANTDAGQTLLGKVSAKT